MALTPALCNKNAKSGARPVHFGAATVHRGKATLLPHFCKDFLPLFTRQIRCVQGQEKRTIRRLEVPPSLTLDPKLKRKIRLKEKS